MKKINKLRPSKIPAFLACPSYCMEETAPNNKTNIKAEIGTCIHKLFEDIISHNIEPDYDRIKRYADDFDLPMEGYDGVNRKARIIHEKWQKYAAKYFQNPSREKYRSYTLSNGVLIEGTCDIDQIHGDMACVLDLKTGETMVLNPMLQIKTYALLIWRENNVLGVNEVYGFCFNPILDYYKIEKWVAQELIDFEKEIETKSEQIGKIFNTGPQCTYCPNLLNCPAQINAVNSLSLLSNCETVKHLDAKAISNIRPNIKFLEAAIKAYKEAEKAFVNQSGSVTLLDGTTLTIVTESHNKWDTEKVLKEVRDYRPGVDPVKYLGISSTEINKIIEDTAGPKMKGKDKKEFMDLLLAKEDCYKIEVVEKVKQKLTELTEEEVV